MNTKVQREVEAGRVIAVIASVMVATVVVVAVLVVKFGVVNLI